MLKKLNSLANQTKNGYVSPVNSNNYQLVFDKVLNEIQEKMKHLNSFISLEDTILYIKCEKPTEEKHHWHIEMKGNFNYVITDFNLEGDMIDEFSLLRANTETVNAVTSLINYLEELANTDFVHEINIEMTVYEITGDIFKQIMTVHSY